MGNITLNSIANRLSIPAAGILILVAFLLPARGQDAPRPEFPGGIRLAATTRGESAITALGKRLPEVAAHYRKTPEQLRALFRSDHCLHANTEGRLFYACELHNPAAAPEAPSAAIGTTDPAPFPTAEAFLLHSRPGANRVIYLDFDGHVDNTAGYWKDGAASPAFDTDGDPAIFSTAERERIIYIWQRVAEDFSMFDINVTTEDPGIEALRKTNSGDQVYGIRCVIGGSSGGADDWYTSGVGGVAYGGTFDVASDVPCWVFPGNLSKGEKNIAEATSHEVGHTLGLAHDGVTGGASYFTGHGNWAPIMGVGYSKEIVQWSKGEYTGANNTQDDLAVMLTQGAVYRPDDHGSTNATGTVLTADTIPLLTEGVIEKRTDLDFFRITAASGSLAITVKPAPRDSNLRIEVKLYDAAGTLLQTASSADTTTGTQPVTLTRSIVTVGDYFFSVDGIGNGDPLTTGYSDYASLGQYLVSITGVIPAGATWLPTAAASYQWNTGTNWSVNPVPNAAAVTLRINNNIAGNQTVNLTAAATLGTLFLGDSNATHGFTIASTGGTLTFDNGSAAAGLNKSSGTNDVISAPLALTGELVVNQSSSGTLTLSGAVSGTGSLTKEGAGTLILTGAKTYSGITTVADGVLRLDTTDALPTSNLALSGGGVIGLASGDFSRAHGTGSNQFQWAGNGGFAAFGADRTVTPGTMSWASITLSGKTLVLGHATADATLVWSSNLSFAGSPRTIQVDDGSAAIDARITSVLSGGGTFNKTGGGLLELTNANTYTATTSVNDGLLLLSNAAALPTTNLIIGGGILGLGSGDLTARTIGTGASQVQWTAAGGFAAFGATRAVKFSATAINWTATNFIGNGRTLTLGHATADATLDWQQPISLIDGARTVDVSEGSAEIDALMSGVISGGSAANSPFNKTGEGTLAFTAQNTHAGDTIVTAGTLMIGNGGTTGGISQNSPNIIVDSGATLAVNRSDTVTQGTNTLKAAISGDGDFSQIGSGTTILTLANTHTGGTAINGGILKLSGSGTLGAAGSTVSVSTGGLLDLNGTNQSIKFTGGTGTGTVANNSGSGTSTLTLAGTATINGGLVKINDHTTTPGGKVAVVIQANTQPLNNLNTYSGGTTVNAGAFLYLNSATPNGAGTGTINLTTAGTGVGTGSGLVVDGTTYANNITGAGYVHNNATGASTTILTGNLNTSGPFIFRAGAGIVYDFAGNGTTSTLSGVIGSTTSMVNGAVATGSIRKSGTGTLTLAGANIHTGSTTVSGGILNLTGNRTATAGAINVGNLNGSTGTLNVSNGTFQTGTVAVGTGDGTALGIVNQSGGTLTLAGNQLLLGNGGITGALAGNGGNGTYQLSGGTLTATAVANRGVMLGTNDGGTSTFNLSGTGNLALTGTSQLMVGRSDSPVINTTNVFNQTGGTASVTILSIGGAAAAATGLNSTFSVTGGTFSATSFTSLGVGNSGMVTINIGGSAVVTLPAFPTARGSGTTATISFNGGTLKPASASTAYLGGLTNAFIKAGGARFDTTNGSITITQGLLTDSSSFNGGLTKTGINMLTLAGINTYTGNTLVSGGTLVLADNAQLKFVLGAASGANNTLTGAGTITLNGDFAIDTTAADALSSGTWTLENASSLGGEYGSSFRVVGFVDAGGNKWTKANGTKTYTFDETTGILTLSQASFASWIDGFYPGETNPLIIGTGADPDFDGIANGVELVIGGNPKLGMNTALLPTLERVTNPVGSPAIPAGNYLLFTYRRSDLSVAGGVTATCETDTDLVGPWTTATNGMSGVVIQVDDNHTFTPPAAGNTDRVRVYVPRAANTTLFGHLKVVVP